MFNAGNLITTKKYERKIKLLFNLIIFISIYFLHAKFQPLTQ